MSVSLVVIALLLVPGYWWLFRTLGRSAACWATDGDTLRTRRTDAVTPYRDGEILEVLP